MHLFILFFDNVTLSKKKVCSVFIFFTKPILFSGVTAAPIVKVLNYKGEAVSISGV